MKDMNSVPVMPKYNSIARKYSKIIENNSDNFNSNVVIDKYYRDLCDSVNYRLTRNSNDNLEYTADYDSARNLINEVKLFFEARDFRLISASYDDEIDLTLYVYSAIIAGVCINVAIQVDESDWDNEQSKVCIDIDAESI